jgi:molecular chaperone DnaK (HSP70)
MAWRALEATGETDTMVVRGLKTQVRKPETTLTVEGYQFSIHELLTFYLRTLLEKKLAARLDQAVTAGDWVEFVFTVPVLDGEGGEDRTRYEERLRAAAIAAGFQDADRNWTISLLPEPDGGLHDVLLNPRTKSAFGNGDRVLVVDIGGGTTDLTLALIGIEGDRPTVREHLNAAASTMRENSAVQVGGNEITFLLGREWFKAERGAAERATGEQAKNRQDLLQRVLTNFGRGEGALLGTHLKFFDNVAASEEPQHSDLNCWFFRYPKLFSILEAHKKDFATKPVQALPVTGEDMESQVTYPQFLKASTDLLQAVVQGVQGLLDRANIKPEDVRHVVPIGGTSKLPQLREALRTLFSDRVIRYEPDLVDTAVCRGAALSRSAVVTPFPFGLVLRRPDGRHTQVVEAGAVLSEPAVKSSGTVEVPKGRHEKVQLLATFGDQQYLLRDFLCTDGSHSVSVRVDASRIAATHVVAGSPVDEFEYPL